MRSPIAFQLRPSQSVSGKHKDIAPKDLPGNCEKAKLPLVFESLHPLARAL
jgi:hypothetical protein